MKKHFSFPQITLLSFFLFFSLSLTAQDCTPLFPLQKGTVFVTTNYNHKGKAQSEIRQTVENREEGANGEVTAKIKTENLDKRGNVESTYEYEVECRNGEFHMDMRTFFQNGSSQAFENMELEMEGDPLKTPSVLKVGDKLEEGTLSVRMSMNGMSMGKVEITIKDREVIGKETITTPAGTFDCFLLTQTVETATIMGMNMKISSTSKNWQAPNAGTIRSESYDKNGKMTGYSEMTWLKRGL